MLIKSTHTACAALLLLLLAPGPAAGGGLITRDVFEPIPAPLRQSLTRRLKLLVQYHRSRRWDDLYGLLSSEGRAGRSKEKFAMEMVTLHIIRFVPKKVDAFTEPGGGWRIRGCARLSGLKSDVDALTVAVREGGEWYFEQITPQKALNGHSLCPETGR
jgi:hypothetical protein